MHKISVQKSPDYYCVVVEPPVHDDRRLKFIKEPRPGMLSRFVTVLGNEQYFVFDRVTFGWRDEEAKKARSRTGELREVVEAMATNIGAVVLGPAELSINPTVVHELSKQPQHMTLEDMANTGLLKTEEPDS